MVGTILVTAATGTVGSEVVQQLSSAGQKVRAAVQSSKTLMNFSYLLPPSPKAAELASRFVSCAFLVVI
jgi:nucleoside-diphosphate-sugar epimerase